jgi:hypothetical protein
MYTSDLYLSMIYFNELFSISDDTDSCDKFISWLGYSCCSHLEHRTSAKRFVSLQFLNLRYSVGLFGRLISRSQGRYLTQKQNKRKYPCL